MSKRFRNPLFTLALNLQGPVNSVKKPFYSWRFNPAVRLYCFMRRREGSEGAIAQCELVQSKVNVDAKLRRAGLSVNGARSVLPLLHRLHSGLPQQHRAAKRLGRGNP